MYKAVSLWKRTITRVDARWHRESVCRADRAPSDEHLFLHDVVHFLKDLPKFLEITARDLKRLEQVHAVLHRQNLTWK